MKKYIFIFLVFLAVHSLYSADLYNFAVSLFDEEDYYRAITEFDRFIFYYPQDERVKEAYLYKVKSYYYAEQYSQGCDEIISMRSKFKDNNTFTRELDLWLAKNYMQMSKYKAAGEIYSKLQAGTSDEKTDFQFIWLDIFQMKWDKASAALSDFSKKYPQSGYKKDIDSIDPLIKEGTEFSPLSPAAAGIFSAILPGAGQIYDKRLGDGLVAFAFISLLSYGTYYYYNNGPDGMFYGFAFLDGIFYLGNIYTAYSSAHKYNRNFQIELKAKLIEAYY